MSAKSNGGGKVRKGQKGDTYDESLNTGKKKGIIFGGLFVRKKDKKDGSKTSMSSLNSLDSSDANVGRVSEESSRRSGLHA